MGQGGLIQLVAYGNQDLFLTSSPSITFFKSSVRRYTAFAVESIQLLPSSASAFGRRSVFVISRNGDLAGAAFIQWDLPKIEVTSGDGHIAWTQYLGHVLAQEITMSIGGSQIDKHTTEWLQILFELQTPASKIDGYNYLIGQRSELYTPAVSIDAATIYTPLQFWYNRAVGLSLPLIALQFHESKIEILVRQIQECYIVTSTQSPPTVPTVKVTGDLNVSIWQDYVFLDVSERSSIAAEAQEQIIQLLSWTGVETASGTSYKSRLAYNHPSLYMAFALRLSENTDNGANRWCDFTLSGTSGSPYQGDSPLVDAVLLLNGTERFQKREAAYFAYIQPLQRFTRVPGRAWIYVYSFSLFPETSQPSGSLNASRIDQLSWVLTLNNPSNKTFQVFFFSQHVNVLRIKSGMAGLAFSS